MISVLKKAAIGAAFTLATVALSAGRVSAFTYSFDASSTSSNTTATGASASVDFDFVDVGADLVQLNLTFKNTTGQLPGGTFGSGATSSKLTGVAFDLFNDVTFSPPTLNGALDTFITDIAFNPFSNSLGNFDIGFADNNNFLGGNANAALAEGEMSLATLVFNSSDNAAALESRFQTAFNAEALKIAARFQQVNAGAGSDKLLGGTVGGLMEPPVEAEDIPEPAALGGLGLLLGYLHRRKKSA